MLGHALLLVLLAAAPDVAALHRELDAVAGRIEELKGRRQAGESVDAELQALLIRSQDLAEEIELARPRPSRGFVEPDRALVAELRESAAELRDEADRRSLELAEVELRIVEVRWGGATVERSSSAARPRLARANAVDEDAVEGADALDALLRRRAQLVARIRGLHVRASNLDAAADALERSSRED